ncbi:MAG: GPR endopeptidase [Clostridiales bacterium]|nr:GPR endopeptidase [Clostridiales bacterium]
MRGFRTDLAMESIGDSKGRLEGVVVDQQQLGEISRTRIVIEDHRASEALSRPCGEYITLSCRSLSRCDAENRRRLIQLVAQAVRAMLPREGEILVVGLGNRNVTADALGTRVVEKLLVTRHLHEALADELLGKLRGVSAIAPGVLGVTGIETAELCRGLIEHVKPAAVIAIDALAAYESARICTTVQITDTGIEPGSGVGNHRLGLTRDTLGVKVIAVGVPMVVYASTIARDAVTNLMEDYGLMQDTQSEAGQLLLQKVSESYLGEMVVTPREIDELVLSVADLLSEGLNRALQPNLDTETLHTFLHG